MKKNIDIDDINERIKKRNISISEISRFTGYSRVTVWRYLNKKREPKISFVNNIEKLL